MDRNSVIGFVLLGVLLFIYLFISTKNSHELEAQRKRAEDSIAVVKAHQAAAAKAKDTTAAVSANARPVDTTGFNMAFAGTEHLITVENELIKVVFSNKGGQPVSVELKQFKAYDSTPVKLIAPGTDNRLNYPISTAPEVNRRISPTSILTRDNWQRMRMAARPSVFGCRRRRVNRWSTSSRSGRTIILSTGMWP